MDKVTVLMPVGPNYNFDWLKEAIESLLTQSYVINELLLVDDGANLPVVYPDLDISKDFGIHSFMGIVDIVGGDNVNGKLSWYPPTEKPHILSYYKLPANVGFTAAFNIGMGLTQNDLVVYLAADDKLMPTAIESAVNTYKANAGKDAWYAFSYIDSTGKEGNIPINAAMITKGLWKMVGGYPPAAFVGPDAAVLSCLIAHAPDRIIKIAEGTPLYWIRDHDQQETKLHTWRFVDEMTSIRNKLTRDFKLNVS